MKTLGEFENLLKALAMKPKEGHDLKGVFSRYTELSGQSEEALVALWEDLEPEPVSKTWPDKEYQPEDALRKRAIKLAEAVVEEFSGSYPKHLDFERTDSMSHLVQHGKLGLMALCFSLEKAAVELKIPEVSVLIEAFMHHIENLVEPFVYEEKRERLAQALGFEDDGTDFGTWVHGRLQPFAMMRSLYLEKPSSELSPLQWWVSHERWIPSLPE